MRLRSEFACGVLLVIVASLACEDDVTAPEPVEVVTSWPETVHEGVHVKNGAWNLGWLPDGGFPIPRAGHAFMTFEMVVTNLSSTPRPYDQQNFQLELSDGTRWAARSTRQPALGAGVLQANESASGWITYEAPVGPRLSAIVWRADAGTIIILRIPDFPKIGKPL